MRLKIKLKKLTSKFLKKQLENIKKQFDDELLYYKKKHKLQLNFINDNTLIIPEYKIELLNKNNKIIKNFEFKLVPFENLNHKKFFPNVNRKHLKKNLKRKKIIQYGKYKDTKRNKKYFNIRT